MRGLKFLVLAFSSIVMLSACTSQHPEKPRKLTPDEIASFSKKDSIRLGSASEKPDRTLMVIAQPDCVHCKQLDMELRCLPNLTVYKFLVTGSSERSRANGIQAWCSRENVKLENCDLSALDRNRERVSKFRIAGTPTIIFPDGTMHTGWMTAPALNAFLSRHGI